MPQADLFSAPATLTTTPAYFASGSNHEGEIKGFAAIGWHVGVAADQISSGAIAALEALAGTGTRVFVDSGAFGEMAFGPTGPMVKKEITANEWAIRLALALRLGTALGAQASIVAPDRVGCQPTTFARLQRYSQEVQAIARTGAEILLPVQKGATPMADFFREACAVVGVDCVPAIPLKKDATTSAELRSFLEAVKPARVHLLGLGPKSSRWAEVVGILTDTVPACVVTCDSVAITAAVGRGQFRSDGTRSAPRGLTAAHDEVADDVISASWGTLDADDGSFDWTDNMGDPSSWMTPTMAKRFAAAVTKDAAEQKAIAKDVTAWIDAVDDDGESFNRAYTYAYDVDQAWAAYVFDNTAIERKRRSIAGHFGGQPLAPGGA